MMIGPDYLDSTASLLSHLSALLSSFISPLTTLFSPPSSALPSLLCPATPTHISLVVPLLVERLRTAVARAAPGLAVVVKPQPSFIGDLRDDHPRADVSRTKWTARSQDVALEDPSNSSS